MPKPTGPSVQPRPSYRRPGPVIEAMEPRRIFAIAGAAAILVPVAMPVAETDVPATPKPAAGADDAPTPDDGATTTDDSATTTDGGETTDDGGTPADGAEAGEIEIDIASYQTAIVPGPAADGVPVDESATAVDSGVDDSNIDDSNIDDSDAADDTTTVVDDAASDAAPPIDASADVSDVPVVAYQMSSGPSGATPIETRVVPGVVERSVDAGVATVTSVPPPKASVRPVAVSIVASIAPAPAALTRTATASIDDLLAPTDAKQKGDDLFPSAPTTLITI